MPTTTEASELVTSIERMLNRSFQGVHVAHIGAAVSQRISDITTEADDETTFDEHSLERGMLRSLLVKLVGSPYLQTASIHLH